MICNINNNAYELDLPSSYNMSNSSNVCDLYPFDVGYKKFWLNSHHEGEDDEGLTTQYPIEALPRRTRSMTKGRLLFCLYYLCLVFHCVECSKVGLVRSTLVDLFDLD